MKRISLILSLVLCVVALFSCTKIIPEIEEMHRNLEDEDYIVTPITNLTEDDIYRLFNVRSRSDAKYFEAIARNDDRVVVFEFGDTYPASSFLDDARDELEGSFAVFARQGSRVILATSKGAYEDAIDD